MKDVYKPTETISYESIKSRVCKLVVVVHFLSYVWGEAVTSIEGYDMSLECESIGSQGHVS